MQDSKPKATHSVAEAETTDDPEYPMHNVNLPSCRPISVEMTIQGMPVCLEVDTGAMLSVMSHSTYQIAWRRKSAPPIVPSNAKLSTYTGQCIGVVGAIEVEAEYNGQTASTRLVIIEGEGPTLLGRDWLQ